MEPPEPEIGLFLSPALMTSSGSEDITSETDLEMLLEAVEVGEANSSRITALSFSLSLSNMEVSVISDLALVIRLKKIINHFEKKKTCDIK